MKYSQFKCNFQLLSHTRVVYLLILAKIDFIFYIVFFVLSCHALLDWNMFTTPDLEDCFFAFLPLSYCKSQKVCLSVQGRPYCTSGKLTVPQMKVPYPVSSSYCYFDISIYLEFLVMRSIMHLHHWNPLDVYNVYSTGANTSLPISPLADRIQVG